MKILIVDDEASILTLLKTALGAKGEFDCTTAASGVEALEIIEARDEAFDCLLLDIQMPGMDGVELCRRIRCNSAYWGVPIIMLTAMSQMTYVNSAFQAGATDYVTKPFDFKDLRARIAAAQEPAEDSLPQPAGEMPVPARLEPARPGASLKDSFRTEVELSFPEIDRLIGGREMMNYLRQTALSGQEHTSAFAVTLVDGPAILAPMSTPAFLAFLSKMAWSLSQETAGTGALITYRGRGRFICVEHAVKQSDLEALEIQVQNVLQSAVDPDLSPQVIVGRRVRKRLNTLADAQDLILDAEYAQDFDISDTSATGAAPLAKPARGGFLRGLFRRDGRTASSLQ